MLTALAGGAVGALLTGVIGAFVWTWGVPADVEEHDRLIAERDEDLATWLADERLRLNRERGKIIEELNKQNLLYSSERLHQLALAKERALHAFRDQERAARRFAAEIAARERFAHHQWRRWRRRPVWPLEAPERGRPILDEWRSPESFEGSPVIEVNDPTARTLKQAVQEIAGGAEEVPPDAQ